MPPTWRKITEKTIKEHYMPITVCILLFGVVVILVGIFMVANGDHETPKDRYFMGQDHKIWHQTVYGIDGPFDGEQIADGTMVEWTPRILPMTKEEKEAFEKAHPELKGLGSTKPLESPAIPLPTKPKCCCGCHKGGR